MISPSSVVAHNNVADILTKWCQFSGVRCQETHWTESKTRNIDDGRQKTDCIHHSVIGLLTPDT